MNLNKIKSDAFMDEMSKIAFPGSVGMDFKKPQGMPNLNSSMDNDDNIEDTDRNELSN